MMKIIQKEQDINLPLNTSVTGKWNKNVYTILEPLGSGANGTVYLALHQNKKVAIKISEEETNITSEVNILKKLARTNEVQLKNMFIEADDYDFNGTLLYFYSMTYIEGEDFLPFIGKNGQEWMRILIIQLLNQLSVLHSQGYIFGDLKPDNMKVKSFPPTVSLLDVGGITLFGRSVKQFTEFFDRGYWGLGSRKAEPTYDLFSVAMIMVNVAYPRRFSKKNYQSNQILFQMVRENEMIRPFAYIIESALLGKIKSAEEMKSLLLGVDLQSKMKKVTKSTAPQNGTQKKSNYKSKKKNKIYSAIETILIITLLAVAYSFYILVQ